MVLKSFDQMNSIFAALKPVAAAALLSAAGIAPALAGGYTTSVTDTVKLDVQGAGYSQTRTGSSYSVAGNNVNSAALGGLGTAAAAPAASTTAPLGVRASGTPSINTAGSSFSFAESAYIGDAVGTQVVAVDTTTGTIVPFSNYGQSTVSTGGIRGTLDGTLVPGAGGSQGAITAGGAGTSATLQRTIDLTVFQ